MPQPITPSRGARADERPKHAPPALLLPVRLETRFGGTDRRPELWVRIYPDQVALDTHEPELTDGEIESGRAYWNVLWRAGTGDAERQRAAWQTLAETLGPRRAAWVAAQDALRPTNIAQRPAAPTAADVDPVPPPAYNPVPPALRRPASWSRPPRAVGLPDRWTVVLYRDGREVGRADGSPVRPDLVVGPDPQSMPPVGPTGLAVEQPLLWMVDFDEAVRAGMALRIRITPDDLASGFDRVLAFGARAADDATGDLAALLDAHHYTDGLALVPQGAPTNNTPDASAAFTRADPGYARSHRIERGPALTQNDARALREALGLPAGTFEHVEHADRDDQRNAQAMAVALWPATLGYYLRQLASEAASPVQQEEVRTHFLAHVRARGTLPALRVGDTPYGVLPVSSLRLWSDAPRRTRGTGPRAGLPGFLRRLVPTWIRSAVRSPRIRRGGDPDAQLVGVLGMDASAREYNARHVLGEGFLNQWMAWLEVQATGRRDYIAANSIVGRTMLDRLGYAGWDPRAIRLGHACRTNRVPNPIVTERPLSETETLGPDAASGNYITWLRHAAVADVRADTTTYPGGAPTALLYKLLRQALLTEYGNGAYRLLIDAGVVTAKAIREREFVGFGAKQGEREGARRDDRLTPFEALDHRVPIPGEADMRIADYLHAGRGQPAVRGHLDELLGALDRLAGLPTAELERLVTETLDTLSHRIDPWVTSLPAERLQELRAAGDTRLLVGGYGWIEDLRARPLPPAVTGIEEHRVGAIDRALDLAATDALRRLPEAMPARKPAREPHEDNSGFVHTPSLGQAAAAAVLRNGHLTHDADGRGQALAVDLSSRRVRTAMTFIEGVQQGQSLAALLGYRFERGLHEGGLDRFVQPFRDLYPVVANRLTEPPGPVERVAASGVVDGRQLHDAWARSAIDWTGGLSATPTQRSAIEALLADLDDVLDALADLSISESVFQIVRGNYARAGGLLDAMSRGERPNDPEVVRTPRAGTDVTHRLMLLCPGRPPRAAGWPGGANPRATAEDFLDAWASQVLPDPRRVRATVTYRRGGAAHRLDLALDDLGLGPLDVLDLADAGERPATSELEQRLLYRAATALPADADELALVFARQPAWAAPDLTFPEFATAARSVRELLAGSRPLRAQDLIEPDRRASDHGGAVDIAELAARATAALAGLQTLIGDLRTAATADALRSQLLLASLYGATGATPVNPTGTDAAARAELSEQAKSVAGELDKRASAAAAAEAAFDASHALEPEAIEHHLERLRLALGGSFPACPRFSPPAGAALATALGASSSLLGGDPDALSRRLSQLAHVRAGVARWEALDTAGALVGRSRPAEPTIAQLPYTVGDRWLGLPLTIESPPSGRISILASLTGAYDRTRTHAGLMIDEWPERIPSRHQPSGLAFHYDQPSNRGPQALLLAVCPDGRARWDDQALTAVLDETLELAKARTVDLDSLSELGQLLPMLYFPFNADGETVSLRLEAVG